MIRRACYALLLTICANAMAEPLYKWTEEDGSITFSPNKPPAGVDFQIIEPSGGITIASDEQPDEPVLAAGISELSTIDDTQIPQPATSSIATLDLDDLPVESASVSWSDDAEQSAKSVTSSQTQLETAASDSTPGSCEDLRKRVVSLERRLKANLSPEDMDNTVVYMSKYQRSYDKFCVQ